MRVTDCRVAISGAAPADTTPLAVTQLAPPASAAAASDAPRCSVSPAELPASSAPAPPWTRRRICSYEPADAGKRRTQPAAPSGRRVAWPKSATLQKGVVGEGLRWVTIESLVIHTRSAPPSSHRWIFSGTAGSAQPVGTRQAPRPAREKERAMAVSRKECAASEEEEERCCCCDGGCPAWTEGGVG
jgi:hypothetical protein